MSSNLSITELPSTHWYTDDIFGTELTDKHFLLERNRVLGQDLTSEMRTVVAAPTESDREDLRLLLETEPGVSIVTECQEDEAAAAVRRFDPDLLVLDVGMSDRSIAECKRRSPDDERPIVIATAADERCAARAFELRALDFLVKPFDVRRVHRAVERAFHELRKTRYNRLARQVISLLRDSPGQRRTDRLAFKSKGRIVLIDLNEIDWIGAEANYVQLNVGVESYAMRESIGRLSKRLDPELFIRIHRSVIVNVRKIKELQPCNSGEYIAVLKNGKRLSCGRGFRDQVERLVAKHV